MKALRSLFCSLLVFGCSVLLGGCHSGYTTLTWNEEVRLNDGRVVVVVQKRNCDPGYRGDDDCISRENSVSFSLPDFSPDPIVWHESLYLLVLNVNAGRLYAVGYPPTGREFRMLGEPKPPYQGFVWEGGRWRHIPFAEIPTEIYDCNVFIGALPSYDSYLTVAEKESSAPGMRGDPKVAKDLKRVDPSCRDMNC